MGEEEIVTVEPLSYFYKKVNKSYKIDYLKKEEYSKLETKSPFEFELYAVPSHIKLNLFIYAIVKIVVLVILFKLLAYYDLPSRI